MQKACLEFLLQQTQCLLAETNGELSEGTQRAFVR